MQGLGLVAIHNICPQNGHKTGSLSGEDPPLSKCIPKVAFFRTRGRSPFATTVFLAWGLQVLLA